MSLRVKGIIAGTVFAGTAIAIGITSNEAGAQASAVGAVGTHGVASKPMVTAAPDPNVDPKVFFEQTYGKSRINWSKCIEAQTATVPAGLRSDPPYKAKRGYSWQWEVWGTTTSDGKPGWHVSWGYCNDKRNAPTYPPTTI